MPDPIPKDDYTVPTSTPPNTVFYLTLHDHHSDKYTVHGPKRSFSALLPHVLSVTRQSCAARRELTAPQGNEEFHFYESGFSVFVLEDDGVDARGYTVLRVAVVREIDGEVFEALGNRWGNRDRSFVVCRSEDGGEAGGEGGGAGEVYFVTVRGPILQDKASSGRSSVSGQHGGMVDRSGVAGS